MLFSFFNLRVLGSFDDNFDDEDADADILREEGCLDDDDNFREDGSLLELFNFRSDFSFNVVPCACAVFLRRLLVPQTSSQLIQQ